MQQPEHGLPDHFGLAGGAVTGVNLDGRVVLRDRQWSRLGQSRVLVVADLTLQSSKQGPGGEPSG